MRVNALKKHPYNYHMKQRPSSGLIWNQSLRKNILSHNQVICLVQHVLDPLDVPLFVTSLETIKLSNGQFPNVVPFLVKKDIMTNSVVLKMQLQELMLWICMILITLKFLKLKQRMWACLRLHPTKTIIIKLWGKHLFGQLHIVWIRLYWIENNIPWKVHHLKS